MKDFNAPISNSTIAALADPGYWRFLFSAHKNCAVVNPSHRINNLAPEYFKKATKLPRVTQNFSVNHWR
jgi:hypothetical protein